MFIKRDKTNQSSFLHKYSQCTMPLAVSGKMKHFSHQKLMPWVEKWNTLVIRNLCHGWKN